ncbi:MAG: exodeoxyribonuclease V subunit gamma [Rubrivivax sp.]|nr:exodeoxyribonuclease V subunit gamma [Rubrivivax sp.]
MNPELQPGLLVLHGNRAEWLAEAVFEWLLRHPLQPLEEEILLVQSNGVAEWLKTTLATHAGICAATRVELPARFLWRAYRQWLGHDAVPVQSALDKLPLTWRLMARLPALLPRPGFEPLAGFLRDGDAGRRLQLAQRLADLYDQYQVYRPDWLQAWAAGRDSLPRKPGQPAEPLPADQLWQALLWRELLAPLAESERAAIRPRLHQRFLDAVAAGAAPRAQVPRRVVLFGMTHLPLPTLQALAALSTRAQVVLAIPNPCRYHWADIIDGREGLQAGRRRHPLRQGLDLAAVALQDMHAHAHPLLAAWGRQGRDFVRQLDAFDDALAARQRFVLPRVDLFDDAPGDTLLQQVQARIRDLVPLHEHAALSAPPGLDAADRSIVFHVAHGAQREVEILHDQLLELLAHPPGGQPLQPRDVVVMVPDIDAFAPAIRAVFGQWPRGDARFIPFDIADLKDRAHDPLLVALEWLLRLPQQRCGLSELRDLLDVPAVAQRFGLAPEQLPRLVQWMEGAGVRWGLDAGHRAGLGLAACGEPNSGLFGLRRMLLGYAVGDAAAGRPGGDSGFQGIEPYPEVGGLEAALAGSLADLLAALLHWLDEARGPAAPATWAERGRALLAAFFDARHERERASLVAAHDALRAWLEPCAAAGFDDPVDLAVAREAWLGGIDEPSLGRRFRAGGVTFCTLMPMRAVPFEVVCLLGMNDGDYPRRGLRSDFDLMGRPGHQRPGDRSRRDDDRQLMLEAVLSARRVLHVSWAGRSARDNSEQPPSVLVSQLRDYLAAGWGAGVLTPRTTEHPLQPFSRRYFEAAALPPAAATGARPPALFTHAREWRAAHAAPALRADAAGSPDAPIAAPDADVPLTVAALVSFLKNPVKDYFRRRLAVVFDEQDAGAGDDEPFALAGLDEYALMQELVESMRRVVEAVPPPDPAALEALAVTQVDRLQRAGRLPLAGPGRRCAQALVHSLVPMLARWRALQASLPYAVPHQALHFVSGGLVLDDWLGGLRSPCPTGEGVDRPPAGPTTGQAAEPPVWLELVPGRLCIEAEARQPRARAERLIDAWVRTLAASAGGVAAGGMIVGRDACIHVRPWPRERAQPALAALMQAWREGHFGRNAPLPLAPRTAWARVQGVADVAAVYEGSAFAGGRRGEVEEACLARVFPDYAALCADGRFATLAQELFAPMAAWIASDVRVEPLAAAAAEPESDRD